jgi:putative heme iron utilization protein
MDEKSRQRLKQLLTSQRVLSLAVLVDGKPYLGLLPYALKPDFSAALVHASRLARHTQGLQAGAPFAVLVHAPDEGSADALQVPRVSLTGEVQPVQENAAEYQQLRDLYLRRFPQSEVTFGLGDFQLFELRFREGRWVEGFAAASSFNAEVLRQLA